jgi:hypothetical protein
MGWMAVLVLLTLPAWAVNSLVWNGATDRVDADLQGVALWPFLEDLAHKTGWHIFIEPGTDTTVSTKFKNLPSGEALKRVLGDLNFALVPQTNGPTCLYIFRTTMSNATKPVLVKKTPAHVPNELMVKLKPGANIDALAKLVGATVIKRNDKLGIYLLQFPDAATTDAALGQLQTNPDVETVDYNYYFDPPPTANPVPAGMALPAQPTLTLDPTTPDSPCQVLVGLIDTPIQPQALPATVSPFVLPQLTVMDGTTTPSTTTPTHGTGMAQNILSAIANTLKNSGGGTSVQTSGESTSVKILPVDVYGSNPTTTSYDVANGIILAVNNGANLINLSLGSSADSAVLDSVVQQEEANNVEFFAAAGNEPVNTPTYPAAIAGVNAVTAVQSGQLASYANYGSFIDMALPGTGVIYLGNQPWVMQGTSVSTAYATGVAAATKTSDCDTWPQIQTAMQQKFVVPAK